METLLHLLNTVYPLSEALQEHLMGLLKVKQLVKKEFLLKGGHTCRNISFIRQGLLHCYHLVNDIKQTSWFMQTGDVVISVKSFYSQTPGYEYIQALEETEVYYISYNELQHIYTTFPEFNFIGRVLTERYYALCDERTHVLRNFDAVGRYKWFVRNFPDLILPVPARYIASFLGIKEETLSRIRSRYSFS